jgi:hypothetical protein
VPQPFPIDEKDKVSEDSEEGLTEDNPGTEETNSTVSDSEICKNKSDTPNPASLDPATSIPPSPAANVISNDHFEGPEGPEGCLCLRRRAGLPKRYRS